MSDWGLVTNKNSDSDNIDYNTASISEIEGVYEYFGSTPYEINERLLNWLTTVEYNDVFDVEIPTVNPTIALMPYLMLRFPPRLRVNVTIE